MHFSFILIERVVQPPQELTGGLRLSLGEALEVIHHRSDGGIDSQLRGHSNVSSVTLTETLPLVPE